MPIFTVPGADLSWALSDEGGRPVVQLHGLTSSCARDHVLDLNLGVGLSGTRLLRYDARGHGYSTGRAVPEDYVWSALAEDLLALLDDKFPDEKVYGVGTSMGCGTLLHAAVREPGRFSGLTVLLPPTAWASRVPQGKLYERRARLVEQRGMAAYVALDQGAPAPPATVGRPETLPEVAEAWLPSVLRGAAQSDLPELDQLKALDLPVRILAWTDDPGHPLSTAETLAATLPHATLTVASNPDEVRQWPHLLYQDVLSLDADTD